MFNPSYILKEEVPSGTWKTFHVYHSAYRTKSGTGLVWTYPNTDVFYSIIMNEQEILESIRTWKHIENAKFYIEDYLNGKT